MTGLPWLGSRQLFRQRKGLTDARDALDACQVIVGYPHVSAQTRATTYV
jgi:hypothetical protein